MSETLYATFADPNRARKAVEELVATGVKQAEISLLVKHRDDVKDSRSGVDLEDTRPTTPMRGTEFQMSDDPLGNNLRQHSVPEIGPNVNYELDPDVEDELAAKAEKIKIDPDADAYRDTDSRVKQEANVHDVAVGAAKGAGIGLGVGAMAAIASLLIPGLGLVIGGGALATTAAALVTGTGVGALAGGITGLLREEGVPEESVNRYATTYDSGGAVLAVTVTNPEMRSAIEGVMRANGPIELETHQAYMA